MGRKPCHPLQSFLFFGISTLGDISSDSAKPNESTTLQKNKKGFSLLAGLGNLLPCKKLTKNHLLKQAFVLKPDCSDILFCS